MTTRNQLLIVTFFAIYLSIFFFTEYSLVGFWTDIIFSIILSLFALRIVLNKSSINSKLTLLLKIFTIFLSLIALGITFLSLSGFTPVNMLKLRSFYFQKVDGRLFNAYFKPVGAYSGGEGDFWITESSIYFPIFEKQIYYEHAVLWNFRNDTIDGQPIDNYEVVRTYIKDEIIEKRK